MRQNLYSHSAAPRPQRSAPPPRRGGARSRSARVALARDPRAAPPRLGAELRATDRRPGSAPRAPRRRRARSRARHPRARRGATRSSRRVGAGAAQQHDLRAPPQPVAVALGLVRDQARGLQVVQPALHAAAVRAHEPRPLAPIARDRAPAHHRRQPHDQLPDRRREPRRALRVPEPEQVALDRVRARLQPIVTRRRRSRALVARDRAARMTTSRPGSAGSGSIAGRYQRRDDSRARRADARSSGTANARRRRGSTTARARERTLAAQLDRHPSRTRGSASGARRTDPSKRGLTIRPADGYSCVVRCICGRSPTGGAEWPEGRRRRPGSHPVFFVLRANAGGPRLRASEPPEPRHGGVRGRSRRRLREGRDRRAHGRRRPARWVRGRHLFVTFLRASPANRC